jgi:phage gp16-like protein
VIVMPPTIIQNKKIHLALNQLGLTDEVYRDILQLNFKVDSSKDLNQFQAERLLGIFKAKGWKASASKKKPTSPQYVDGQARKIVAMWIALADAGVIRNRSDRSLQAYVKRQTGVDNLKWCDGAQLRMVIEGLKRWASRKHVVLEG